MAFWKISLEPKDFSPTNLIYLAEKKLILGDATNIYIQPKLANIRKGDYFYLMYGNSAGGQGIQLLGRITAAPQPCDLPNRNGWQQCSYEVIKLTVRDNKFYNAQKAWTPYYPDCPIFDVPEEDEQDFEDHILRPYFGMKINPTTHEPIDIDAATPAQIDTPKRIFPLNQILYGPPGTGKTYLTTAYAVAICGNQKLDDTLKRDYAEIKREYNQLKTDGRICFTTFHQSYGYEDFIEGIRPDFASGDLKYIRADGIFKKFCETARGKNWNFVFIIDEINRGNISKIFGELITLIEDDKREEISATRIHRP